MSLPDGRVLVHELDLQLARGERLLIVGPSGSGKSTLVRAVAGVWPFAKGEIEMPAHERIMVLPQRPYLPLGPLREALLYPSGDDAASDSVLEQVLEEVGLPALRGALDDNRMWSHVLSLGEQQRLAFARVFLQRPAWLVMDEATSGLDEPAEAQLYRALIARLPQTGVLSVGHRSSLQAFHDKRLRLSGDGGWQGEQAAAPSRPPYLRGG